VRDWYLVAVKNQPKAEINLRNQGYQVYAPKIRINDGKVEKLEPAFPTYLFTRFDVAVKAVATVNNTFGVRKMVTFGGQPARIHNKIIEAMHERFDSEILDTSLKSGDRVIIKDGPFAGIEAVFKETDKERRAILLVSLISRTHKLAVDHESLERV